MVRPVSVGLVLSGTVFSHPHAPSRPTWPEMHFDQFLDHCFPSSVTKLLLRCGISSVSCLSVSSHTSAALFPESECPRDQEGLMQ